MYRSTFLTGPSLKPTLQIYIHLKDQSLAWLLRKLKIQVEAQNTRVKTGNFGSQGAGLGDGISLPHHCLGQGRCILICSEVMPCFPSLLVCPKKVLFLKERNKRNRGTPMPSSLPGSNITGLTLIAISLDNGHPCSSGIWFSPPEIPEPSEYALLCYV